MTFILGLHSCLKMCPCICPILASAGVVSQEDSGGNPGENPWGDLGENFGEILGRISSFPRNLELQILRFLLQGVIGMFYLHCVHSTVLLYCCTFYCVFLPVYSLCSCSYQSDFRISVHFKLTYFRVVISIQQVSTTLELAVGILDPWGFCI